MILKIDELIIVSNHLLEMLNTQEGNEIEIEDDFYWDIPLDEVFRPYEEPSQILLGQLSSDLERINSLLADNNNAIPYDLKRIAIILKYLSKKYDVSF